MKEVKCPVSRHFRDNVWEEWAEIWHVHLYLVISRKMEKANFENYPVTNWGYPWLLCSQTLLVIHALGSHDDVMKWKYFPRYWPFVRGIHRSPVNSPHKGQWRGALIFSLICVWINGWVNNREAGDLRRYRAHYDVSVIILNELSANISSVSM